MTARTGMTTLISTLRSMTNAGTADYTIAGVSFWSDDEVQRVLDRYRLDVKRVELYPIESYDSGTVVYKEYRSPYVNLESGTAVFELETAAGSTLGTANYTMDYIRGVATFATSQGGTAYFMTASTYDLNAAAADLWRMKAAQVANLVNFSTDNHSISRSDLRKSYLDMANYYASQGAPHTVKIVRDDVDHGHWIDE